MLLLVKGRFAFFHSAISEVNCKLEFFYSAYYDFFGAQLSLPFFFYRNQYLCLRKLNRTYCCNFLVFAIYFQTSQLRIKPILLYQKAFLQIWLIRFGKYYFTGKFHLLRHDRYPKRIVEKRSRIYIITEWTVIFKTFRQQSFFNFTFTYIYI